PRGVRHPDGVTVPTDPSPHIRKVFGNSLCSTASIKFSSSLRPRHSGRVPRSLLNPESFLLTQNLVGRRDQPENKLLQSRASFQDMNRDRSVPPYRLQVTPGMRAMHERRMGPKSSSQSSRAMVLPAEVEVQVSSSHPPRMSSIETG
ncbi:hypothetical protein B0H10DRAFT_2095205, partial [Mycena sp. CBHHK59/15]